MKTIILFLLIVFLVFGFVSGSIFTGWAYDSNTVSTYVKQTSDRLSKTELINASREAAENHIYWAKKAEASGNLTSYDHNIYWAKVHNECADYLSNLLP